jgi:hypothetical protein
MTERRVLYADENHGYPEDQDFTSDTFQFFGLTIGAGNLAMGSNRITGVPDVPTASTDAVNQNYVDSVASGLQWREPADVFGLVGNATVVTVNGLTPTAGDAYVMTDAGTLTAGSLAVVAGDMVQYDGSVWVKVVAASGGFPPDGTRAVLSTQTALVSPYTDATDDGKIVEFDGTSLTGADTGEATDGSAILINGEGGYYENNGFVYDGTVPTGTWIQFTGAGQINAGDGLSKDGNTLNVNAGDGIAIVTDRVTIDLADTNPGLELTGTTPDAELRVLVDGAHGIILGASGVELEIDDTPDTLDVDADGLKVVGLPQDFKINDVATHYDDAGTGQVTAANLDTLTAGSTSDADALHTHSNITVEEAKRVEDIHTAASAITAFRAVCWSATADKIEHADNGADLTSQVIGIAKEAGVADDPIQVVKYGVLTGFTGLTQRTAYYLGATGQLVVYGSVPRPGRVIRCGFAKSTTDLDIQFMDFGRRAA